MKYVSFVTVVVVFYFFALSASIQASGKRGQVVLMTHDSFSISKSARKLFETRYSVTLKFIKAGDAGIAINQAILSRRNPLADVFFGVDNTLMSRALKADMFETYASPLLSAIPERFKLDSKNRLLPVDFGDVCLNYDKRWFSRKKLRPPKGLEDLVEPGYRGLTVVQNPATSSPGLAFLFATIGHFGEGNYLTYWRKLRQNGVLVTNGWKESYWGHFTAASKGSRPIVVSYASSPPVEVYYSKKPLKEAPTKAVVASKSCFRQIEFVGVLKGCENRKMARKLIDFMLSKRFQDDIPLQMFVFPVNRSAVLPEVFEKHSTIAKDPVTLGYEKIHQKRAEWIENWTDAVIR